MDHVEKLKEIFSNLFLISSNDIHNKLSQDEVSNWDSMQHLNLILAIEEEFSISISPEEATEMLNFGLIAMLVKEKIEEKIKS